MYDSATEQGCPLCVAEAAMPRAPGGRAKEPEPAPKRSIVGYVLLAMVLGGGGYAGYWYKVVRRRPSEAQQEYARARANAARVLGETNGDTTRFVDPNDLTPVRRARALKATLESMLHGQRGALLSFPEGPLDTAATDRATKRRVRGYVTFATHWQGRINAATRTGTEFRYAPGVRYGPQMETVTNQLQAALSVMRDMVPPDRVQPRHDRQHDITEAGGFLNAAGTVLTNLPK